MKNRTIRVKILERLEYWWRRALCWCFNAPIWHATLPAHKQYPLDVTKYLNSRPGAGRKFAMEIGCGIGDISAKLDFDSRQCYDIDKNAIKLFKIVNPLCLFSTISFGILDFPKEMPPHAEDFDAIILVNWIHELDPQTLKAALEVLFGYLSPGGELVIDTVADTEYRFNHDVAYLSSGMQNCARPVPIGEYARGRVVWAIKRNS